MSYDYNQIDKKWQKKWEENKIYKTGEDLSKDKFYVLDMFPYPSGEGLHVGHIKGYVATDIMARFKRMKGFNVLHPMGWDAFGLPAENYAIKNKVHPQISVEENIKKYKKQFSLGGFSYDWDKEINTTDSEYYKWTQWCFLKMLEKGLAYESHEPINWCPTCKTGLANEDLEDGNCERCDTPVEQKPMRQWVLKITEYAERLIDDLKTIDWEDSIVDQQLNWIGKSQGVEFSLDIKNSDKQINVYTTRIDTVYGMTYVVLAPEHKLVQDITLDSEKQAVEEYSDNANKKTLLERTGLNKDKAGVFTGSYAINPFTNKETPIYISDYVVASYGTGAVMAVPAHDTRDYEFAKKYDLEIVEVIKSIKDDSSISENAYTEDGVLVASGDYTDLTSEDARDKMATWLSEKGMGGNKIQYRLRDWVFSRQRYWGEPIPVIHCEKCGAVPVPEDQLPVELPSVDSYEPTDTGESPLANIEEWVNTKCPKCQGEGKRETNTMPQWAGSSWYYLRYIDPKNNDVLVDLEKEKYWMNVDLYVGGAEHASRHLLYARFWHKVLYDVGAVSTLEPFQKLYHVGVIGGEDGRKMSKRWGNVVNPSDVVTEYGADSLRMYEMFMGPFSEAMPWNTDGIKGISRFLDKVYLLKNSLVEQTDPEIESLLHKTIKKVTDDIDKFSFNTAIAQMMIFARDAKGKITKEQLETFLIVLCPFAPHLTEEIWESLGCKSFIVVEEWPEYDESLVKDDEVEFVVQVNSKLRDKITCSPQIREEEIKQLALKSDKIKKYVEGNEIKRVIFIAGKLINFIV